MGIISRMRNLPLEAKASSAYAICSIVQKCLTFITLPIFYRLLSVDQYGQVTVYNSWSGMLSLFLSLNLAYGSFSTAMVKYEDDRDGYISSVQGICLLLSIVFLAIYLPGRNLWNKLFELPTFIMCVMVAEILFNTSISLWSGKKRFEFNYKAIIKVTLFISIVSPILQIILVTINEEKGYAKIIGAAIVSIAVGGFLFFNNNYKGKKVFNKKYWHYALSFNIPLLTYYLSQVVFNQSDRIMISHMVGKDKAAIYDAAYSLAMVFTFILNAINNSYVPWYYRKIKEGKTEDNKSISLGIAGFMAIIMMMVIWFAPEIILFLAGSNYLGAVYVVPPVAISLVLLFYSQLFINVEFYYEEKNKLVWASIGAALTNLVLNWFFISRYGFIAAAYTTLLSYILFTVSNYLAMNNMLKKRNINDFSFNYKGLILLFIAFVVVSYMGVLLYDYLIPRIAFVFMTSIVLVVKKNTVIELYKRIKG